MPKDKFFNKIERVFRKLRLQQCRQDPALLLDRDKKEELRGMKSTHVYDFLMTGSGKWLDELLMGKVKDKTLDQRELVRDVKQLVIPPVTDKERSLFTRR